MGGSFYGGMTYAKSQTPARPTAGQFGAGRTGFARGGAGGGATAGQIVTADSTSMTVKLASGSTQLVLLGSSTTIAKSVAGTQSDLTPGTTVIVTGTSNSDGSITANSIQIRPAMTNTQ